MLASLLEQLINMVLIRAIGLFKDFFSYALSKEAQTMVPLTGFISVKEILKFLRYILNHNTSSSNETLIL
jgi:hypothetical protein